MQTEELPVPRGVREESKQPCYRETNNCITVVLSNLLAGKLCVTCNSSYWSSALLWGELKELAMLLLVVKSQCHVLVLILRFSL